MMGGVRFTVVALSCTVLAGCYSYRPTDAAVPGTDVRARLTAEAAVRRSQGFEDPILHFDGTVVESTRDSLALDVLVARTSSTFQQAEIRDTVRLGTAEIQSIMERRISVAKSLLVGVGAGVAAFAIAKGIDQIVGGTNDEENGGPPTARVPLLRWLGGRLLPVFGPGKR